MLLGGDPGQHSVLIDLLMQQKVLASQVQWAGLFTCVIGSSSEKFELSLIALFSQRNYSELKTSHRNECVLMCY